MSKPPKYPFEHFYNQMPKEIQELITSESLSNANEFETMQQAVLYGIWWNLTKSHKAMNDYYNKLKAPVNTSLKKD